MSALTLHWTFYAIAWVAFVVAALGSWMPRMPRMPRRFVASAIGIGLVAGVVSSVARWTVTGHPPMFGTFENTIAASLAVGLVALYWHSRRQDDDPLLRRLILLWVLALLAYGAFFPRTPYPLTISERSIIVDVHVLFAWTAFALLLTGSMAGVVRVIRQDAADAAGLDETIVRGLGLGFAALTAMIAVGAVYSYLLFGDWYRWEIVGATTVAAWLGYGASLHAYLMFGWRGRKLAWCAIAMLPLLLMVFWSWSVFQGTYHYFDITAIRAR